MLNDEFWSKLEKYSASRNFLYNKRNLRISVKDTLYQMRVRCRGETCHRRSDAGIPSSKNSMRAHPAESGPEFSRLWLLSRIGNGDLLMAATLKRISIVYGTVSQGAASDREKPCAQHHKDPSGRWRLWFADWAWNHQWRSEWLLCSIGSDCQVTWCGNDCADKGYDSECIREQIAKQGTRAAIPRKRNSVKGNVWTYGWGIV